MNDIYNRKYGFDKNAVLDRLDELNEQIEEEVEKAPSPESADKYRNLMYQQLIEGIKICTGYRYF